MTTMHVRRAGPEDRAAVAAIVDDYCTATGVVVRDGPVEIARYLHAGGGFWFAEAGADVAGCVAVRPLPEVAADAAEIKRLYVRPAWRRRGVAAALMDALEDAAAQEGYRWLYLDTHHGLPDALRFYTSRGYEPTARYSNNPQATAFFRRAAVRGRAS